MKITWSAVLAVCAGALPLAAPAVGRAATLLLDLRADQGVAATGGLVDSWADQSGAGNAVTATGTLRPTLITSAVNGKPALSFNDAQKLVGSSNTAFDFGTGDFTMVAVVSFPIADQGASNSRILGNLSNASPFGGFMLDADLTASRVAAVYRAEATGAQNAVTENANYPVNAVAVYIGRREGGAVTLFRNGQSVGTGSDSVSVNGDAITIGAERTGGSEFLTGQIFEVQMYSGGLTAQEVANLQSTFSVRWNAVPEPTSLGLLGLGAAGLLARRRRTGR